MRGIPVKLHVRTQTGTDAFNAPVYTDAGAVTDSISLYGKRIEYMLGIPKGDAHDWTDTEVEFFGARYRTFGAIIQGIEENVPTAWHKKVRVESYE